jgi:hypothetical protein
MGGGAAFGLFSEPPKWRQLVPKVVFQAKHLQTLIAHFTAVTSMVREDRALNNFTQPSSWSRVAGKKDADALELAYKEDSPRLLALAVQHWEVPFATAESVLACLGGTTYVPDFGDAVNNKSQIKLPGVKGCGGTNNEVRAWCAYGILSRLKC